MEINQDRVISMAAGFQYSKILLTANELGIFKFIGSKSRTAAEVASGLKLDAEATGLLLGALVGLGLVTYKAGRYKNAPDIEKYLGTDSDEGLSCIATHMNHMYESWNRLDAIIKKGRPKKPGVPSILTDKHRNRNFICGMFEIGMGTARLLAKHIDLKGVMKMADIGGGPAQYPIAFSEKNPDTGFIVADYPSTVRVARGYIKKYGLQKRIKAVDCEFFDVPELGIGDDYDMALLSQVLHAAGEKKCVGADKEGVQDTEAGRAHRDKRERPERGQGQPSAPAYLRHKHAGEQHGPHVYRKRDVRLAQGSGLHEDKGEEAARALGNNTGRTNSLDIVPGPPRWHIPFPLPTCGGGQGGGKVRGFRWTA